MHSAECCADAQQVPPCRKAVGLAAVHEQQTAWQPPMSPLDHRVMPTMKPACSSKFPSLWSILMPLSRAKPFSRLQDFQQFDCGFASIPFPSERSVDGPLIVPSDICSVEGGCLTRFRDAEVSAHRPGVTPNGFFMRLPVTGSVDIK